MRELFRGTTGTSEARVEWDGLDAEGHLVPPGLYVAHVTAAGREAMRRITLLR